MAVKLIVGMGLPGAGKSTILKEFAEKHGYAFVSVDSVRKERGLDSATPSTEREWDEIRARILDNYHKDKTVVMDGVFLGDNRKKFLDFARRNGISKIQGVFINTPEELAWMRVVERGRVLNRETFDDRLNHLRSFPPSVVDGFDSIFTLNEVGELVKAEVSQEGKHEYTRERKFS